MTGVILPSDPYLERVILAAVLLNGNAPLAECLSCGLRRTDFYDPRHRLIFRAVQELDEQRRAFGVVEVVGWLRQNQLEQRAGNSAYLGDLISSTPSKATLTFTVGVVRKLGAARDLIARMQLAIAEGYGPPKDLRTWFESSVSSLDAIARDAYAATASPADMGELAKEAYDSLLCPPVDVAATHLAPLDRILGPLHSGHNLVLAGRPGMGKTMLALNMALHEAANGYGVIIQSLEQPKMEMAKRLMMMQGNLNGASFRAGTASELDFAVLAGSADAVRELPIRIVDDCPTVSAWRASTLREARSLEKDGYKTTLIITDYLQLMSSASAGSREQEISEASRGGKHLAKELDCCHVAISQLNRGVEDREVKKPLMRDLRESGSIEQDADAIVFIYRDAYYTGGVDPLTELIVAKNRHGDTGIAEANFLRESGRFMERKKR